MKLLLTRHSESMTKVMLAEEGFSIHMTYVELISVFAVTNKCMLTLMLYVDYTTMPFLRNRPSYTQQGIQFFLCFLEAINDQNFLQEWGINVRFPNYRIIYSVQYLDLWIQ